jgi:pimeloyl-ACP methyl ester carboxylesterase
VRGACLAVAVALITVAGGAAAGAVVTRAGERPANATPVVLVRGYAGWKHCPGTDVTRAYWGDAVLKFSEVGWQADVLPLSFYECDSDGVDITGYGPTVPRGATPTVTSGSPRVGYTSDTPMRRLAHDLAWFVYDQFSIKSTPVDLVGFSMGGLVLRYAIYRVAARDPDFPPYLNVPRAVTIATPHAGMPDASICGPTRQCRAMVRGSAFMTDLMKHALDPQGRGGTAWTVAGSGSKCDLVSTSSALAMPGAVRVHYLKPCYTHGDYLWDYSDASDASMQVTLPFARSADAVTTGRHLLLWLTRVLQQ